MRGDIGDKLVMRDLLGRTRPAAIVHFAAESHVDRSIDGPEDFIQTNVVGTFHLLEEARRYLTEHPDPAFRFLHVSTDEVFGALGPTGSFVETTPYDPRSPYSASKAASDHLVSAYVHTYKFPAITTNCSNNYGPYQFPEKLIPLTIANALAGKTLPVYGKGENVRDWIYVTDHCAAVRAVLAKGRIGECYLDRLAQRAKEPRRRPHASATCSTSCTRAGTPHRALIEFVTDRPGHDFRYSIDPSKIERELGWRAQIDFDEGIAADDRVVPREPRVDRRDPVRRLPAYVTPARTGAPSSAAGAGLRHSARWRPSSTSRCWYSASRSSTGAPSG